MSTENQVSTEQETQIQAPGTAETQDVAAPDSTDSEAQTGGESDAKPEKTAAEKEVERLRRQITKRDRTQGKLYQELQAAQAALQRLGSQADPDERSTPVDEAVIKTEAQKIAHEIVQMEKVTESINSVLKAGKALPDFDAACNTVNDELPFYDGNGRPTQFLTAVLEFDQPAQLLHHLGKNPDIAAELADLSPIRRIRRLDAIERELSDKAKPKTSSAPRPLEPVKPGGGSKDPSEMTDKEFAQWRRSQIAKRS